MKGKRMITPIALLLMALIAGCFGFGYVIGTPFLSVAFLVLLLLLAAWGTKWRINETR